jgi:N-acetylneuraminic acid mutarotase
MNKYFTVLSSKLFQLLILIVLTTFFVEGQGEWIKKSDFAGGARWGAVGFSIGEKGYFATGRQGTTEYGNFGVDHNDLWEWDSGTNTWTQKSSMPTIGRRAAVSFVLNNKGYVAAGFGDQGFFNDLWEYDPAKNKWIGKESLPAPGFYGGAGFSIGKKGYVCFGNEGTAYGPYSNKLWEYDPKKNKWTQRASCPAEPRYGVTGVATATKAYVGLGGIKTELFNDFWEYFPATDKWKKLEDYPGEGRGYVAGFVIDGKVFIGTGHNNGTAYNDFWGYDPLTEKWSRDAAYEGGSKWLVSGFSIGGKGYFGTGADFNGNSFDDFWEYNPGENILNLNRPTNDRTLTVAPNPFTNTINQDQLFRQRLFQDSDS